MVENYTTNKRVEGIDIIQIGDKRVITERWIPSINFFYVVLTFYLLTLSVPLSNFPSSTTELLSSIEKNFFSIFSLLCFAGWNYFMLCLLFNKTFFTIKLGQLEIEHRPFPFMKKKVITLTSSNGVFAKAHVVTTKKGVHNSKNFFDLVNKSKDGYEENICSNIYGFDRANKIATEINICAGININEEAFVKELQEQQKSIQSHESLISSKRDNSSLFGFVSVIFGAIFIYFYLSQDDTQTKFPLKGIGPIEEFFNGPASTDSVVKLPIELGNLECKQILTSRREHLLVQKCVSNNPEFKKREYVIFKNLIRKAVAPDKELYILFKNKKMGAFYLFERPDSKIEFYQVVVQKDHCSRVDCSNPNIIYVYQKRNKGRAREYIDAKKGQVLLYPL
ncbi:MAG: hypothetical protein HQK53_18020 [Oligoflexia bacterium]|nr:hypothetical protein [Oligoflexia bacterium]